MGKIFFNENKIYFQNIAVLFVDNFLKIIVGFIFSVLVARYFGPGKFGKINYVLAIVGILQVIVMFGIDEIILKDFGLGITSDSKILYTTVGFRLVLAVFSFIGGCILFYYLLDKSLVYLFLILGLQLFLYPFYSLKQWFQIKSLNRLIVISSQISLLCVCLAKLFVLLYEKDLIYYAFILLGGLFIEVLLLFSFYCRKNPLKNNQGKFDYEYFSKLLKGSLPLLFQNFAVVIYMKIDQVMIGKMLSPQQLGIYSISVAISELLYFVPMSIVNGSYPKIVNAKKENCLELLLIKIGSINFVISVIFAVFCTFFVPFLVKVVYGNAYINAGRVIQIHCWAGLFVAIGVSHSCFLVFENIQIYSLISMCFGAILNVVLNFLVIPSFGIDGAAIATVISQFFASYFCFAFFKDKRTFVLRTKSVFCFFRNFS
ncbi:MAG: flippase [Bacteroidales bacterium]|nr:flippase [Bacteroidales bacterium]